MRHRWIDIARGICILCVVLSHSPYEPTLYRCIFEPFFLTTFFFLSGVVFNYKSIGKSLFNCSTKILWPYFVNSIIVALASTKWIGLIMHGDISAVAEYFQELGYKIITGKVFWFLACLFIVQLLAILIIHLFNSKKKYIFYIAAICLSMITAISGKEPTIWNSNTAIFALGYFLLGYVCQEMVLSYELLRHKRLVGFITLTLYISIIVLIYITRPQPLSYDMHNNELSPELPYLLLSFIGIFTICTIGKSIHQCSILEIIGTHSLVIYMYHGYGLALSKHLYEVLCIDTFSNYQYCYSLLFSFTATLITLVFAIFINRYCPIIIGRGCTINNLYNKLFRQ